MDQVYPDEGLVMQLIRIATGGFRFKLFTNDITPDRDTILTDLTEAAWSGYAHADRNNTNFPLTGVSGNIGYLFGPLIGFNNTSGADQAAYGYYITDQAETVLLAATRFDGAPVTKHTGQAFTVVPTWGDFSEQPI